jgi:hypothetical protein
MSLKTFGNFGCGIGLSKINARMVYFSFAVISPGLILIRYSLLTNNRH